MTTLHLTADEQKLFKALRPDLMVGYTVEPELLTFEDSEEKMKIRFRNLSVRSPVLQGVQEKAKTLASQKDMLAFADGIDPSGISKEDMLELYFALGPSAVGRMLQQTLKAADSGEAMQMVHSLSFIRHGLLLAMNPSLR